MKKTLKHPAHGHALCLQELSNDFTEPLKCSLCRNQIHGPTSIYYCEQCDLFLHKSCANLPSKIQHPFHSQHPLVLIHDLTSQPMCSACNSWSWFFFRCDQCYFIVDALCALATLPQDGKFHLEQEDESNATIEHFLHNHRLTAHHADLEVFIKCIVCDRHLSGDIYGCYDCIIFLHKQCAELPREIWQHPSHSQHRLTPVFYSGYMPCDLCSSLLKSGYRCDECKFNLDMICALSILALEEQREENDSVVHHPFHEHQLSSFHMKRKDMKVRCKACEEEISSGAYGCSKCLYFLHKSCAQLPSKIKHPLHDKHLLTLSSPSYFACKNCMAPKSGFSFACRACQFDLDIECALQYPTVPEQAESPVVELSIHHHPLKHIYVTKPGGADCELCKGSIKGAAYQCSDADCKVRFHKSCAETPTEIEQAYHPQHPLTLFKQTLWGKDYICSACQFRCDGYLFGCGKCNFYLHIRCAMRKPTLRHYLHEHSLTYFGQTKSLFHCNFCGHGCKIDSYRCPLCNFNIHHDCTLLLPKTYKHRRHIHPLTLHHAICDDDFGEYCCDICEKDRNPDRGVYYCKSCNYVAHIECVIPMADPGSNITFGTNEILPKLDETVATIQEMINKLEIELEELKKELEEVEQKRVSLLASEFRSSG